MSEDRIDVLVHPASADSVPSSDRGDRVSGAIQNGLDIGGDGLEVHFEAGTATLGVVTG
jgi:hypothetical protein